MKKKRMIIVGALVICFALIIWGSYEMNGLRFEENPLKKETREEDQSFDPDTDREEDSGNSAKSDNIQRFDDTSEKEAPENAANAEVTEKNTTNAEVIENSDMPDQNSEQPSDTGERWTPYVR